MFLFKLSTSWFSQKRLQVRQDEDLPMPTPTVYTVKHVNYEKENRARVLLHIYGKKDESLEETDDITR